jgi:membrane protease YdiL (CAAX protease family)
MFLVRLFRWIGRIWTEIHEESIDRSRTGWDWRLLVVLGVVTLSLSLQEFYGNSRNLFQLFPSLLEHPYSGLLGYAWWSGWRVFGLLVMPVIAVLCMPGERLRDYGWSTKGFFKHLWLYVLLFLLVLPFVYWVSHWKEFQRIYPFYKLANRSAFDLWSWELLYAAQFLSLEFFFRGFMLHATKRSLGIHSVWLMCIPYCMIHYGKTFAESMAAVVAGLVLGTVSLRTKSIWGGVVIHIGVAISMDLMSLKYLPKR